MDSLLICLVQESRINFEGDADMQFSRVRQFALHRRSQRRCRDAKIERSKSRLWLRATDQCYEWMKSVRNTIERLTTFVCDTFRNAIIIIPSHHYFLRFPT